MHDIDIIQHVERQRLKRELRRYEQRERERQEVEDWWRRRERIKWAPQRSLEHRRKDCSGDDA